MESNIVKKAQRFALEKHRNQKKQNGITPFMEHLEGVVNRLKNIGITNQEILSAAWPHDTLEHTDTTFEELNEIFDNKISVLVLSLSKNMDLPKKEQEFQYVKQLKSSNFETKIIKICDISTNLKDIDNAQISRSQKNKKVKKMFQYARVIKEELSNNKNQYPKIIEIINGINSVGKNFRQRPLVI